eukprot:242274-Prymnesium_polylepis.1
MRCRVEFLSCVAVRLKTLPHRSGSRCLALAIWRSHAVLHPQAMRSGLLHAHGAPPFVPHPPDSRARSQPPKQA